MVLGKMVVRRVGTAVSPHRSSAAQLWGSQAQTSPSTNGGAGAALFLGI